MDLFVLLPVDFLKVIVLQERGQSIGRDVPGFGCLYLTYGLSNRMGSLEDLVGEKQSCALASQ